MHPSGHLVGHQNGSMSENHSSHWGEPERARVEVLFRGGENTLEILHLKSHPPLMRELYFLFVRARACGFGVGCNLFAWPGFAPSWFVPNTSSPLFVK